jgi:hypothetical protein
LNPVWYDLLVIAATPLFSVLSSTYITTLNTLNLSPDPTEEEQQGRRGDLRVCIHCQRG